MNEWMMVCVIWCMLFWDSSWTTNTLVLIRRKKACLGWTWARRVWGWVYSLWVWGEGYQCVAADWIVWENLRGFFSCKPVMGEEKSVSAQCQCGSWDSPHFPQALCSQRDDGTLVTSKCTPYQPPTHPFPANPPSFPQLEALQSPFMNESGFFFWCLVQLLNVQCVQ